MSDDIFPEMPEKKHIDGKNLRLEQQLTEAQELLASKMDAFHKLEISLDRKQENIKQLEYHLSNAQFDLSEQKRIYSEAVEKIKELEAQLEQLKNKYNHTVMEHTKMAHEVIKVKAENQKLRDALNNAKNLFEESAEPFDKGCMIIKEALAKGESECKHGVSTEFNCNACSDEAVRGESE